MTDPGMAEQVELMEQVWSSIDEVCSSLRAEEWDLATECPGWSVKDQVSHMAGNESGLLGRPIPDVAVSGPHLKNPVGELNEKQVEARRPWPPAQVLAEWREVTGERLRQMRSWAAADWDDTGAGIFGAESGLPAAPITGMQRRFAIRLRIFDAWMHEQDIRRATGRPGHMSGAVAAYVYRMMLDAMPYVVGKKVGAPDGSTVAFDVSGGPASPFAIGVTARRANPLDAVPASPTVRLTLDFEAFACLAGGRWSAERALADGRVKVEGDQELGRRVLEEMNIVP